MDKEKGAPWAKDKNEVPPRYGSGSLRGWWFYTRQDDDPEEVRYQGQFVSDLGGGNYVVQLFSWLTGCETNCMPVHFMQVVDEDWILFPDIDMRDAWYENYTRREAAKERRKP